MTTLYLAFNALMYAVFALWCTLAPQSTRRHLGLDVRNSAGESEYLAVYGGLQAGVALYYALACFAAEHRSSALWMSVLLYGGLASWRTLAVARFGFRALGNARLFFCAELALFLAALALLVGQPG